MMDNHAHTSASEPAAALPHSHAAYYVVYAALLVLLAVTVVAATVPLGRWAVPVALSIAGVKTFLIVVYFMHLRTAGSLVRLFAAAGFLWLGLLLTLTFADYLTRGQVQAASVLPERSAARDAGAR